MMVYNTLTGFLDFVHHLVFQKLYITSENGTALVNLVLNIQATEHAGKQSCGPTTGGLLSSAQLHRVT
jgi:hypothetical protein